MAKGKKSGGRDFKKGQSGNPKGRPPVPDDIKQVRKLAKNTFDQILNRTLFMTLDDFNTELKRTDLTMFERSVMQLVQHASAGCEKRLNMILDRTVGKTHAKMEVPIPEPFVIESFDGKTRIELGVKHKDEEAVH